MTLQRPNVFLCDKYLKYFGWLTSDHCEIIRVAAIQGLLALFQKHLNDVQTNGGKKCGLASPKNSNVPSQTIDMSLMENVITKFIPRLAHALTDGPCPTESIQIHLMDLIVYSVRSMPEHHALMTNWTAMLKAILDDKAAITLNLTSAGDRADVAKQKVLVRMLATAACVEVGSVTENPTSILGEKGVHMMEEAGITNNSSFPISQQWEELSIALLHALPDLLIKFIGDSATLASLTLLPRYLIPTIFSHPARKQDFARLLQLLSKLYCETCQDEIVLEN